jgi:prepilin-type N-terminal cleavage/methylation domain-containing protein
MRSERGFTLVELLMTIVLLALIMTAVLSITDATKRQATADQERSATTASAQTALARMTGELRQACAIFAPGFTPTAGRYCFNQFSAAPAATTCPRATDCVDFVKRGSTDFSRSGNSVSSITHPMVRVRYECARADPASTSDLARTECVRFSGSCGATSCPSPTTQNDVLVRSILNSGASATPPIFQYCTRSDPYGCNVSPGQTVSSLNPLAAAMVVSVRVARRGERRAGTSTSELMQDGVELKNIAPDSQST